MPSDSPVSKFGQTFVSYGSYHHNLINKIIHILCIPVITATFLAMLTFIPLHLQIWGHSVGAFHVAVVGVLGYYLSISWAAAAIMGVVLGLGTGVWLWVFGDSDYEQIRNAIIVLNIVGWGLQFVGHGVFEKRKPALLDNALQILSAPLFVVIELGYIMGLRTAQMEQWMRQIDSNVEQLKAKDRQAKAK